MREKNSRNEFKDSSYSGRHRENKTHGTSFEQTCCTSKKCRHTIHSPMRSAFPPRPQDCEYLRPLAISLALTAREMHPDFLPVPVVPASTNLNALGDSDDSKCLSSFLGVCFVFCFHAWFLSDCLLRSSELCRERSARYKPAERDGQWIRSRSGRKYLYLRLFSESVR